MPPGRHLANDAWEALLSAHAVLVRRLDAEDIWADISMREYDVLYTLSKCPGPVRLSELNRHVLLSHRPCPGWSTAWPGGASSSAGPTPPTAAASACRSPRPAPTCSARSAAATLAAWPAPCPPG